VAALNVSRTIHSLFVLRGAAQAAGAEAGGAAQGKVEDVLRGLRVGFDLRLEFPVAFIASVERPEVVAGGLELVGEVGQHTGHAGLLLLSLGGQHGVVIGDVVELLQQCRLAYARRPGHSQNQERRLLGNQRLLEADYMLAPPDKYFGGKVF